MKIFEAAAWVRQHTRKARGTRMVFVRPSTAELRRWLRDPNTPPGVRPYVYEWLLWRKHARRRT